MIGERARCRVRGLAEASPAALGGCSALLFDREGLVRLGALAGGAVCGLYFWAAARGGGGGGGGGGSRPPVAVRVLPLDGKGAADAISGGACGADDDGPGAGALECWLSSTAACSLGLVPLLGAGTRLEVVLELDSGATRAALVAAESIDVTVTVQTSEAENAQAIGRLQGGEHSSEAPERGATGSQASSVRPGVGQMDAQELALISDRLVPIVRSQLAAQVWSVGMSTRARIGATSLLLTTSGLRPRSGVKIPPAAFSQALIFDQDTAVSVRVSCEGPAPAPSRDASTAHADGRRAVDQWVAAAAKQIGGVTADLTRAATAIYTSIAATPGREVELAAGARPLRRRPGMCGNGPLLLI